MPEITIALVPPHGGLTGAAIYWKRIGGDTQLKRKDGANEN